MKNAVINKDFYIELWGGDSCDYGRPSYIELLGWSDTPSAEEKLYKRCGTLDGIIKQYKELAFTAGLIYHIDPNNHGLRTMPYTKSREEIRADGHYKKFEKE